MLHSPDGSFSAWIATDGVEVPEYHVATSADQKTVTCWIPSEMGKRFSIHWKNSSYTTHTQGDIKLDGNSFVGKILYGDEDFPVSAVKEGVTDATMIRHFVFSSLELTDDDDLLNQAQNAENVGSIQLNIYPIEILSTNSKRRNHSYELQNLTLHERSKKAITQQIKLAEPEPVRKKSNTSVSTRPTGPDLVRFCFNYRPLDVLQANGMAPAPKNSKRKASSEEPSESTTSDLEEMRVLRRKLTALEAKVKKEKKPPAEVDGSVIDLTVDADEPRRSKKVKREGSDRRPFNSGEVIDLT
ncbi:hypothetical protein FB45DRAFT_1019050 [Roridomyces roridus]|uniref:DUF7918 domain-containing protein n=1 Tax=Roridomyces roridus TaxID=1738132 RepID=A0AAD7CEG0_9AGAR|nr:hypothetical protein FB45DRAFT_1019050 [Roridomyces roridus]